MLKFGTCHVSLFLVIFHLNMLSQIPGGSFIGKIFVVDIGKKKRNEQINR